MKSRSRTIGILILILFLSFLVQPVSASGYGGSQTITEDFIPLVLTPGGKHGNIFQEYIFQIQESFRWDNNTWQTNEWHLLSLTLQVTNISPNVVYLQVDLYNISFYLKYPDPNLIGGGCGYDLLSTVNFAPATLIKIQSSSTIYNVPQGISNRAVQYSDSNTYPSGNYLEKQLCYIALLGVSFTYQYSDGTQITPSATYPFYVPNACEYSGAGPCPSVPITIKPLWTTPQPTTDSSWLIIPFLSIAIGTVGISYYTVEKRKRGIQPTATSNIFCKNCGQKMTPNLKFCTQCGTPLT